MVFGVVVVGVMTVVVDAMQLLVLVFGVVVVGVMIAVMEMSLAFGVVAVGVVELVLPAAPRGTQSRICRRQKQILLGLCSSSFRAFWQSSTCKLSQLWIRQHFSGPPHGE